MNNNYNCLVSSGSDEGDVPGPQRQQHADPGACRGVPPGETSRQEQAKGLHRSVAHLAVSYSHCTLLYIDRDGATPREATVRQGSCLVDTRARACRRLSGRLPILLSLLI